MDILVGDLLGDANLVQEVRATLQHLPLHRRHSPCFQGWDVEELMVKELNGIHVGLMSVELRSYPVTSEVIGIWSPVVVDVVPHVGDLNHCVPTHVHAPSELVCIIKATSQPSAASNNAYLWRTGRRRSTGQVAEKLWIALVWHKLEDWSSGEVADSQCQDLLIRHGLNGVLVPAGHVDQESVGGAHNLHLLHIQWQILRQVILLRQCHFCLARPEEEHSSQE
mmetsp:Transcript_27194/g.63298  ORF Transcript_27194/g.63298 Transcript_27194/m.63298 type:complete len:223 (+) Transcript_27194:1484-2152(+)